MTTQPAARLGDPKRTGIRGALIAGVVLLVIAALVFATSFATEEAADRGLVAVRAEAVLGANDVALKATAQAVLLAEDRSFGVADDASVMLAVDEALERLQALKTSAADLDEAMPAAGTVELTNAVAATGAEVVTLAANGDVGAAATMLDQDLKAGFESLRDTAAAERNASEEALASTGDLASRAGSVARFLVAFLLPLALVIAYRVAARRQLRVAEVQLDTRLAAEHEVIRAKDEFIANMSHELRTPLTSIYGFSEVLLDMGLIDPDSAMDLIGLINTESAELGRMVEDLLVSARAEAGALAYSIESVDLATEVDSVVGPITRDGTEVHVDLADAQVLGDPLRVRQIIRNLCANAIRYGGEQIEITSRVERDRVVVTVADDGDGIPEDMVPRLFTRFVHEGDVALTVGSIGLGLAVVKSLVDDMNGGVEYTRSEGWTRFTFWLPVVVAVDVASHAGPRESVDGALTIAASMPLEDAL